MPRFYVLKPDKQLKKLTPKELDRYLAIVVIFHLFLIAILLTLIFKYGNIQF